MNTPLTIVIPTINEESTLPLLLSDIEAQVGIKPQVIIADGGSNDSTIAIAAQYTAFNITVLQCPAGRAKQMNAAWQHPSSGATLLFLHADSRLCHPSQLLDAVKQWRSQPDNSAGHFALSFEETSRSKPSFKYQFLAAKTATNRRYTINGDQGLLIKKSFLEQLGGFDERLPFLEDQCIAEKIHQQGHWVLLPGRLKTSARRFETEGFAARYHLMTLIMVSWKCQLEEFFKQSPKVYQLQPHTKRLNLAPYLRLVVQIVLSQPSKTRKATIFKAGHFALENLWQLFFFTDQLTFYRLIGRRPLTAGHDLMAKLLSKIPAVKHVAAWVAGYSCWLYLRLIAEACSRLEK